MYRNELKYRIGMAEYLAIRQRLRAVMKPDPHAGPDGRYVIRSIYFDNADDKALREKADGVPVREKFRLRYYNNDFSYIKLEKKEKHDQLCLKSAARITQEECRALLEGRTEWMMANPAEPVRELYCKMKYQQLRPRVLVSYVREPYVYAPGNVRITFDSQIRTSLYHQGFLGQEVRDISAQDSPGEMLMEIKYDEFLPEIISHLIQSEGIRQSSFSKYGASRRFG